MSNVIIAIPLSDEATLTGTDARGANSVGNLQNRSLSRIYRTETTAEININFGSATEIDFIALIGHNGQGGTVTVKAGTTSAATDFTSGPHNLITGTDVGNDKNLFAVKLVSAETYQYWKLEISDTSNTDGYFDAGRIYLDKAFQPITNINWGLEESFQDNSRKKRTISGDLSTVKRTPLRTISMSLDFGTKDEMYDNLRDIDYKRGISRDLLIIPDMDDTSYFQKRYVYGTMDEAGAIISRAFQIYQKSYQVTEII